MARKEWERQFSPHILFRGMNYAREGNVRQVSIDDGEITAFVSGSEEYEVEISVSGSDIVSAVCSCPYAADGNMCKHMAAVMYVVEEQKPEALLEKRRVPGYGNWYDIEDDSEDTITSPLSDLLKKADRSRLESIIKTLVANDETLETYVRATLTKQNKTADIVSYESAIDSIFESYSDRDGYINYYNAMHFQEALSQYLENVTDALIENEEYYGLFRHHCG